MIETIKENLKFRPGDCAYVKQDVMNDRSSMSINGKKVREILLQNVYIISSVQVELFGPDSMVVHYVIKQPTRQFTNNGEHRIACRDYELCSEAEASAILQLKSSST